MTRPTSEDLILRAARRAGVVALRDLEAAGISRVMVGRLVERGLLERLGRGLYAAAGAQATEHNALVQAALRVPRGVVCLLSALQFHGLGAESPHEVWLALDRKDRKPAVGWPPLRIVRFSGLALRYGVKRHVLEGVPVRITSPAKTVADCFKYRNKVGLDVTLAALREYGRRRGSVDELARAARVDRVSAVMRPYLEALS